MNCIVLSMDKPFQEIEKVLNKINYTGVKSMGKSKIDVVEIYNQLQETASLRRKLESKEALLKGILSKEIADNSSKNGIFKKVTPISYPSYAKILSELTPRLTSKLRSELSTISERNTKVSNRETFSIEK